MLCFVFALLSFLAATAGPLYAEQSQFRVSLLGLPVGELQITTAHHDASYKTTSRFRTKGLAGALARVRFHLSASGFIMPGGHHTASYAETVDTGRRVSRQSLGKAPFAPVLTTTNARRSLDPATALMIALAPRRTPPCPLLLAIYDGQRRTELRLSQSGPDMCIGVFRRISGYSAQELAERQEFPVQLRYNTENREFQASRVRVGTLYGPVVLKRR